MSTSETTEQGHEVLTTDECWSHLAEHHGRVGRLALGGSSPDILPVNYAVDGRSVVFRTAPGKKLAAIDDGARVAFEVDEVHPTWRSGWSVVLRGFAQHVTDADERARLAELPLEPWASGDQAEFVRIATHRVSGRRIGEESHMSVREWMSPDPVTVRPETTVAEARTLLESEGIRHLPVVDSSTLIGIVSDRDIGISDAALRAAVKDRSVDTLLDDDRPVEAVMSSTPHVITADAGIADAARLMVSRRINALPVLDDDGVVGIITSVDCLLASLDAVVEE